jgi:tetratricopeptide (TPR) repeat protein
MQDVRESYRLHNGNRECQGLSLGVVAYFRWTEGRSKSMNSRAKKGAPMFSFLRRLFSALSDPAVMLQRGDAAFVRGDLQQALGWYQLGLQQQPELVDLYEKRGTVLLILNRYEEALADFEVVIARHPDPTIGYQNRAIAYEKLGRAEEALADYARAIARTPDYWPAYANRALLLARRGERDKALADIQVLDTHVAQSEHLKAIKHEVDDLLAKNAEPRS